MFSDFSLNKSFHVILKRDTFNTFQNQNKNDVKKMDKYDFWWIKRCLLVTTEPRTIFFNLEYSTKMF